MENLYIERFLVSFLISTLATEASGRRCLNTNNTYIECTTHFPEPETPDEEQSAFSYGGFIIIAVLLIPMTVLFRCCWIKHLRQKQMRVIEEQRNRVRQDLHRSQDEVFMVDVSDNTCPPMTFHPPPSYEESQNASTRTDGPPSPPPYEPPPPYSS